MDSQVTLPPSDDNIFTISEKAAQRIEALTQQENKDAAFRISVSGGGCSGFQYNFTFDQTVTDTDTLIEKDQARVVIDAMSLAYVKGSELHFVQELIGSRFEIRNPNATARCGCGTSFSVF